MNLDHLHQVIPPPEIPVEAGCDWDGVERTIETRLPRDYRAFIESYGTGAISSFLWVYNPFSKNANLNLLNQEEQALRTMQEILKSGDDIPFPLPRQKDGLLPWAATGNGDLLFWRTHGAPDLWPVVVADAKFTEWHLISVPATQFIYLVVTRRLRSPIFPEDFPGEHPVFEPVS